MVNVIEARALEEMRRTLTTAARRGVTRGVVLPNGARSVPEGIARPSYAATGEPPADSRRWQIHDAAGIEKMRRAGALAGAALEEAERCVGVGVTTDEIDAHVHDWIVSQGAYPSPFGYAGFVASCCISVNEVICHGIPDTRPLEDGDIVNVDVSAFFGGVHGDTSKTLAVGNVDAESTRLVAAAQRALDDSIALCKPGTRFAAIGDAIMDVCDAEGYTSNEAFCGHGIGTEFHMMPFIYHFRNDNPGIMEEGMTFTIEPMVCEGVSTHTILDDGWTVVTTDGGRSAQFEHTLLITADGVEILSDGSKHVRQ